jgi:hypothetical protein
VIKVPSPLPALKYFRYGKVSYLPADDSFNERLGKVFIGVAG